MSHNSQIDKFLTSGISEVSMPSSGQTLNLGSSWFAMQPRDKAAMVVINAIKLLSKNLNENGF